jgi:hypothetical protein
VAEESVSCVGDTFFVVSMLSCDSLSEEEEDSSTIAVFNFDLSTPTNWTISSSPSEEEESDISAYVLNKNDLNEKAVCCSAFVKKLFRAPSNLKLVLCLTLQFYIRVKQSFCTLSNLLSLCVLCEKSAGSWTIDPRIALCLLLCL